jgi:hypothetical protein
MRLMKRKFAWALAISSGLYLVVAGPLPDPLPIIDEATALLIFAKSMAYLGYDVARWVPFLGKRRSSGKVDASRAAGQTVDI